MLRIVGELLSCTGLTSFLHPEGRAATADKTRPGCGRPRVFSRSLKILTCSCEYFLLLTLP
jgi:hypothetical protein